MKLTRYLFGGILLLCCLSCVSKKDNQDVMEIDVSNPQSAYLDDVADGQKVIPIQEDSTFDVGNVFCSKSYGGMIFLYNDALRQINCVDEEGKPVFSLNALGRGEGEYIDIGTFTYNDDAKTLDIFERATRTVKSYAVPSMKPRGTLQMGYYISAMEWIKGNTYLFVRESSQAFASDSSSLELYDMDAYKIIEYIHIREDQANIEDYTVSRKSESAKTYVAVPGAINVVYSVTETNILPSFTFEMSPDYLTDKKYWEGEYNEEKYEVFCGMMDDGSGGLASFPLFYNDSGSYRSFYYFNGSKYYDHALPSMNLCLLHGTEAEVYDTLRIKGIDNPISPIGVHNGKYVALLETENLEYSGEMGEIAKEILQAQENGAEHVIVLYSFK